METKDDDVDCKEIVFDVKLVKGCDPILIEGDENNKDNECYPTGYNKIFEYVYPPEEWTENGKKWRRVASTKPADRHQVMALAEELKLNLEHWNAKMHGVCPVRRELYTQCFNELIRQVCVNSIDQGELLIKIRNEYNQSIINHKRYFESGLIFRIKHASLDQLAMILSMNT
uniref:Inner dynein arm light chain, axonemal n=1 Tax=Schizaphis graminum TaxID=13262 RepID=A0A2S2NEW5_SCHGA